MHELSLGISPCPNDIYIFSGLLLHQIPTGDVEFRVDFQDVETLNRRALAGDIDAVKISYANYPRCAAHYDLLECGGALGRGVGPLLLAQGDDWDPEHEVLVPGEFTTANFLLDFYAGRTLQKRYLSFDALYRHLCETPGAQGVVINEKRFSYPNDGLTLIQDLGAYWEEQTNLPIPLGAIVVRKSLGLMAEMERWVRASLAWADTHREEALVLCRQTAGDLTPGSVEAHIALYVNDYTRDLGTDGRAAVEFFLHRQRVSMVK
jgi:1,4-dihydroxy-6-naphthoate synthase